MALFIRLLDSKNKEDALLEEIRSPGFGTFYVDPSFFENIPGMPFAYWVADEILKLFSDFEDYDNEDAGRTARCGLGTLNDFRFIRAFWEVPHESSRWTPFFGGGKFKPFYDDFRLKLNWGEAGHELKTFVEQKVGSASRKIQGEEFYFHPGFTFPRRTRAFCPKFMPAGGIFSNGGQAGFAPASDLPAIIAILSSTLCTRLMALSQGRTGSAAQYEVGLIKRLPWPDISDFREELTEISLSMWRLHRTKSLTDETSLAFISPSQGIDEKINQESFRDFEKRIDDISVEIYGLHRPIHEILSTAEISHDVHQFVLDSESENVADDEEVDDEDVGDEVIFDDAIGFQVRSWAVGVAFGRFDIRLATGEREPPPEPEPFDPLPARSPGMLPDGDSPFHSNAGILADDVGHAHDLPDLIGRALDRVGIEIAVDTRAWLRREFFALHLRQYSKSGRKAPIYWPLSTASGNYTLWLYYPALTDQTLFVAANDFVGAKLEREVEPALRALRQKTGRSREEERELEDLQFLHDELRDLRSELLRLAPIWTPNHDDGVQITAAPLWRLFHHRPWQAVLRDTWEKLEEGAYDWAHLAMVYWPDRVREKCRTDKSLAIAHDLEELYEPPPEAERRAKSGRGRKKQG
jgi:hypothetical protein